MGAFFFFFLMPQPAAAFFLWWLAGSRIIETSLDLVPVTGVPSAAQRCLSCATVRRMSDSSVSLLCCGVIRCDMVAGVSRMRWRSVHGRRRWGVTRSCTRVASVHTQLHSIVCTDACARHAAALTPHVSAQDVQLRLALAIAESGDG